MKRLLLLSSLLLSGCWAQMYESVNQEAQNKVVALDAKCKPNFAASPEHYDPVLGQWCVDQIRQIRQEQATKIAAIDDRRRALAAGAAGLQAFGQGMSNSAARPVTCQTYTVGRVTNTYCH